MACRPLKRRTAGGCPPWNTQSLRTRGTRRGPRPRFSVCCGSRHAPLRNSGRGSSRGRTPRMPGCIHCPPQELLQQQRTHPRCHGRALVVTSPAGRCRRQCRDGSAFKSSKLQSSFAVATLANMSDRERDRDGGGLAVLMLAVFVALLVLLVGGGALYVHRRASLQRDQALIMEARARRAAESLRVAAIAAANEAAAAIESPAPPAPETPPPTQ